jgi:hypothetical protein
VSSVAASDYFSNLNFAGLGDGLSNLSAELSPEMRQSASGNTGPYFGVSFVGYNDIGDVDLKYRGTSKVAWVMDVDHGASARVGWDFGLVRVDLKGTATDGGVDTIDGNATADNRSNIGIVTANIYWDVMRTEIEEGLAIVPYVGVGGGGIGFHTKAISSVDPTDGSGANNGGDGHSGIGYAAAAHAGVNFEINDHMGVVLGYELVQGFGGHNDTAIHLGEIGIRVTF